MERMPQRKPIKTLYLWLIFVLSLLIGIVLILEVSKHENNTFLLVLMVIDFVIMTLSINTAISRTFKYKPRPKKYIVKKYTGPQSKDLDSMLVKLGFNRKSSRFGHGYIKVDGDVAYKIVVIDDHKKYFTTADNIANEAKEQDKPTPGIENCTKFIGFEIFYSIDDEAKEKILEFAFQGKSIYYDGFYYDKEQGLLVEPNHVKPKEQYQELFNNLLEMISFIEQKEE